MKKTRGAKRWQRDYTHKKLLHLLILLSLKKKKGGSINCGEFSFSQHLTFSINNFIFKRGSETLSEALADVLFEKVDDCNGICETTDITGVKITPLSF